MLRVLFLHIPPSSASAVNPAAITTGTPFPKNFLAVVKVIFKRLFRVYGHMYHQHFDTVMNIGVEAHLNTCFKHFIFFVQEFDLVNKAELAPLQDLIDRFNTKTDKAEEGAKP